MRTELFKTLGKIRSFQRYLQKFSEGNEKFALKTKQISGYLPNVFDATLTPVESHGIDLERFKNPSQALSAWKDKQDQTWEVWGKLQTENQREFEFFFSAELHHTQNDLFSLLPSKLFPKFFWSGFFTIYDHKNANPKKTVRSHKLGPFTNGVCAHDPFHLALGPWSFFKRQTDAPFSLFASTKNEQLSLEIESLSEAVLLGSSGYLQLGEDQNNSQYRFIYPKQRATGTLAIEGRIEKVSGDLSFWHYKQTSTLNKGEVIHPRTNHLFIPFKDGSALSIFLNKEITSAFFIDAQMKSHFISPPEIKIENIQYWKSNISKLKYVIKQKIEIPSLQLNLEIAPFQKNQEIFSFADFLSSDPVFHWCGTVLVSGHKGDLKVEQISAHFKQFGEK